MNSNVVKYINNCCGFRIRIRDEQPRLFFQELKKKQLFGLKYLNSWMRIRDSGWKNSDPGSGINIPDSQHLILPGAGGAGGDEERQAGGTHQAAHQGQASHPRVERILVKVVER